MKEAKVGASVQPTYTEAGMVEVLRPGEEIVRVA
jgi:hypothetical protein